VVRELRSTKDEARRDRMLGLINEYGIKVLDANDEADKLSRIYVSEGIIPEAYDTDALHIAAATVAGIDFIVSLNFKHIVKHKTIIETEIINAREGYKRVFIHSPAEVIDHDENA
jgi:hypothetical protein